MRFGKTQGEHARMDNPIDHVRQRQAAIKRERAAGVGEVGIFWFFQGDILPDSIPYTVGEEYGDFVNGRSDHCNYWRSIKKLLPAVGAYEYDEVPRGRVIYSKRDEMFHLYGSRAFLNNPRQRRVVLETFAIPEGRAAFRSDEHYELDLSIVDDNLLDRSTVLDSFRGALLGLAVGDAVGTQVEFCPPGTFTPVTDIADGGPFDLKAGQWTDDTSMALCMAESLIEQGRMDPRDQLQRYVRWWREGHNSSNGKCFDIGNTTRDALQEFERTGDPQGGPADEQSAGNGSLMRLAPAALFSFYKRDIAAPAEDCAVSSRTTHGARLAVDACRLFGVMLHFAAAGASKADLLSPDLLYHPDDGNAAYWAKHPLAPELLLVIEDQTYKHKMPPEIRGKGYVLDSLEAALWAFHHTDCFRDAILDAVNLGDDADTVGAICGQIAGAHYGEAGIPEDWRERLWHADRIRGVADQLHERALGLTGEIH